jgi:hypothetical protein
MGMWRTYSNPDPHGDRKMKGKRKVNGKFPENYGTFCTLNT